MTFHIILSLLHATSITTMYWLNRQCKSSTTLITIKDLSIHPSIYLSIYLKGGGTYFIQNNYTNKHNQKKCYQYYALSQYILTKNWFLLLFLTTKSMATLSNDKLSVRCWWICKKSRWLSRFWVIVEHMFVFKRCKPENVLSEVAEVSGIV